MLLTNLTAATMRDGYGLIEDAAILIEGGRITSGPIERGWWSAMWYMPRQ